MRHITSTKYISAGQIAFPPPLTAPTPALHTNTEHGIPYKNYETDKQNEPKLRFISSALTRLAESRDSPTYSSQWRSAIITVFCDCGREVWSKAEHNGGVQ
jgi:hypothetical protein